MAEEHALSNGGVQETLLDRFHTLCVAAEGCEGGGCWKDAQHVTTLFDYSTQLR